MMKQLKLFKESTKSAFGGSLLKNSHAKSARPFSAKASMHIVLKANKYCLKHYDRRTEHIIEGQARQHYIKIYNLKNVGNHIHLVIKAKNHDLLKSFLRAVCGLIPRMLKQKSIWQQRPFSRIVKWGKAYRSLQYYMSLNQYESLGYSRWQARFMLEMDKGLIQLEAG